jgi:hypothetical protein
MRALWQKISQQVGAALARLCLPFSPSTSLSPPLSLILCDSRSQTRKPGRTQTEKELLRALHLRGEREDPHHQALEDDGARVAGGVGPTVASLTRGRSQLARTTCEDK